MSVQSLDIISVNLWQILISLANLLIITFVLKRFLFKRVQAVLTARQEQVSKILGTSKQYYQKYEKGLHPLPVKHLVALALYYGTSADYLLGLTDQRTPYPRA